MSFLMVPRAFITTGTLVVLSPHIRSTTISKSLNVFGKLFHGFDWGVRVEGYSHVNKKAGFIVLAPKHNVRPISCYGPVSVNGHVPQNSDAVILGDSLGFMLIASFLHLNAKLFADLLVHVCSCLVVAVGVFSFSKFREAIDQAVNDLVETATQSTFCVHVRLQ